MIVDNSLSPNANNHSHLKGGLFYSRGGGGLPERMPRLPPGCGRRPRKRESNVRHLSGSV